MHEQVEAFSVRFLNVISQRFSPENRIQLILALKGDITVTVEGAGAQTLQENQPQVINCNTSWQAGGEKENILAIISISPFLLFNQAGNLQQYMFNIEEYQAPGQAGRISERIKDIATLWLKQNNDTWRLEAIRALLEVLCILHQYFKTPVTVNQINQISARVSKAVAWIKEHYHEYITLNQIASQLHVTSSHLSRRFSAEVGMSFRQFLIKVRFEHAVKEIALTYHPIGQIVSNNGFSSLHHFSLLFPAHFGLSPAKKRHDIKTEAIIPTVGQSNQEDEGVSQVREVSSVVLFSCLSRESSSDPQITKHDFPPKAERIAPSFSQDLGQIRTRRYVIAVGNFNELLKQHVQQQLICLKDLLSDFQVEIADPLAETFALYNIYTGESHPTWSPWSNLNMACSFLKKTGIGIMFRLSPTSKDTERLVEFIHHNSLLLGTEYVENWSFMLDSTSAENECQHTHCLTWLTAIRLYLPESQIGLSWPQETGEFHLPPIDLLDKVDFIGLSVIPNDRDSLWNIPEYKPQENNEIIHRQIDQVISLVKKHNLRCRLYLQSWSTLTGNTLTINGLFFRGALLMDMMLSLPQEVVMLGKVRISRSFLPKLTR